MEQHVHPLERDPSSIVQMVGSGISGLVSHPYASKHDRFNALDARLERVPALLKTARARLKTPMRAAVENLGISSSALAKSLRDDYTNVPEKDIAGDKALKERLKKNATAAAAAIEAYAAEVQKQFPVAGLQNTGIGAESWATLARLREGVLSGAFDRTPVFGRRTFRRMPDARSRRQRAPRLLECISPAGA